MSIRLNTAIYGTGVKCKSCTRMVEDTKYKMCERCRARARGYRSNVPEYERKRRQTEQYQKSKNQRIQYARQYSENMRRDVINHYGGKCAHCGNTDMDVLTIDHIHNNGNVHRRSLSGDGKAIFRFLVQNNYPPGYQVLCRNCNWKKHLKNIRRGNG